jgi:hypothetical protein
MMKVKDDLTGRKFDKLTVLKQVEDYVSPSGKHLSMWLCECDCEEHNQICVTGSNLISENTKSCGCILEEMAINGELRRGNTSNIYEKRCDELGEYYVGIASNTGSEFYFDEEDYDIIQQHCWYEATDNHGYHCMCTRIYRVKSPVKLHHLILGKNYDHIDRNPLNNRRHNLRKATRQENSRNQSKSTRNTSGIIGVGWYERYNKWRAYIKTDKMITLGYFANKDDAIRVRLNAEVKYFGEFAPQRHLYEQYGIKEAE